MPLAKFHPIAAEVTVWALKQIFFFKFNMIFHNINAPQRDIPLLDIYKISGANGQFHGRLTIKLQGYAPGVP